MEKELEKLNSFGVQKIYDDTHIPVHHIKAMLHSSFDGFSKVQFLGFLSILEREYAFKLPYLKSLGIEYFKEKEESLLDEGLLVMPVKKRTKIPLYISIVIIILIAGIFVNFFILKEDATTHPLVENSLIEDVQKNIIEPKNILKQENLLDNVVDVNKSNITLNEKEENLDQEKSAITLQDKEQNTSLSFKIVPRAKVWFGYIDVEKSKKRQATIEDTMNLDANKSWLLFFGHGYIDMYVNGEVQKFDSRNKRRFFYKNSTLKSISSQEFKTLSRGLKW